ncbi:MAG: hypothetical protein IJ186_02115 [Bacilli bacterium]|nr:hypothetical protein [Bacilli bacterium]
MKDADKFNLLYELICMLSLDNLRDDNDLSLIFHYTGENNLKSIFEAEEGINLWHMKHQNDALEYSIEKVSTFFKIALKEIYEETKNESILALNDFKIDNDFFFNPGSLKSNKGIAYICCFSKNDYCKCLIEKVKEKNSGNVVKLSFLYVDICEELNRSYEKYIHLIFRVIYDDSEKIELIKRFLKKAISFTQSKETLLFLYRDFANICRFAFKDIEFKDEEEIRSLIVITEEESSIFENKCINNNKPIHLDFNFKEVDLFDIENII